MGLSISVGDETQEILDREATRQNNTKAGMPTQYVKTYQEPKPLPEVLSASLNQDGATLSRERESSRSPIIRRRGPESPTGELELINEKHHSEEYIPRGSKRSKTATTTEPWNTHNHAPSEIDNQRTLETTNSTICSAKTPTRSQDSLENHNMHSLVGRIRNNIDEVYPTPSASSNTPPFFATSPSDLPCSLPDAGSDVRALKRAMLVLLETHENDMKDLKDKLHREYAHQERERLRVTLQREEKNTMQALEAKYRQEIDFLKDQNSSLAAIVTDLKKQVMKERTEKAELVEACDQYLSTNGF